jgi:ribosome-binding factor A
MDRMDRVCEGIKRELSLILQEKIDDPRLKDVSITRVDVSRDLRTAKVYYIGLEDEDEKNYIGKAFKRAGSFMRAELAKRVNMKFTPRLNFFEDKEEELEERIEKTFNRIEEELEASQDRKEGAKDEQ